MRLEPEARPYSAHCWSDVFDGLLLQHSCVAGVTASSQPYHTLMLQEQREVPQVRAQAGGHPGFWGLLRAGDQGACYVQHQPGRTSWAITLQRLGGDKGQRPALHGHCALLKLAEFSPAASNPVPVHSCRVLLQGENPGEYILILCNAIGSPVDSKYIDVEPKYIAITNYHVIAASDEVVRPPACPLLLYCALGMSANRAGASPFLLEHR